MQQYEKDHLAQVLQNAAECTVLLKSNGDFPLEKPCKIDAYGAGMRYTVKGGTGSGEVNSRYTYTIEESLEREGFTLTSKSWLDGYDAVRLKARKEFAKAVKAEAREKHENPFLYCMGREMPEPDHDLVITKNSDVAIYVVARNSGEGSDRRPVEGDVKLSKAEVRDILACNKLYDKFLLVLNVGGALDLSPVMEVKNILLLSQLGVDCGKVLSDILLGKQNPSGKLTTTWAAWEDYSAEGTFGDWDDTYYNEGIYVGYRYFDSKGKNPLFSFGYGLSYTEFSLETVNAAVSEDSVTLHVKVKNIGTRAGKEVVQVYVSKPAGKLDQPYQDLAGFAKTRCLMPEEEEEVVISFTLSDLASYDTETASYILEAGDYVIRVGNSSADTKICAVARLEETVTVLKARNCLGTTDFEDLKLEAPRDTIPADITVLNVDAASIRTKAVDYDITYDIDERVKSLTDEELAFLEIGAFDPDAKGLNIIGNAAKHVAGAAGETTSRLEKKGIRPLIMADGPAGLRLAKEYYEDEKGAHAANNPGEIPQSVLDMMGPVTRFIAKKVVGVGKTPKNVAVKEQACTMIPIGCAIAQSFNLDLAKSFGDLVGKEMEMFGVHLWLAPALNIHRSILCGRNFEYYSEDPLVSGLMAAAITQGVQSHPGRSTTIKHYAANNAETNRYCNNSHVSERAMREIYLRGFGICVRKSQPHALMTSYNMLNGTHTAEHRGLIEDVLRCEYGFKGIVMTDWVLTVMDSKRSVYRNSLADEVAKASGDLFMPGGKKDYERVLSALKNGTLSRKQLEENGTRVLGMIDLLDPRGRG